jgi:hypothetical protein
VHQHGIVGGDAELARGPQVVAGDLALERHDVLAHALGKPHHLLAAGGERIAGAAALEQARAELTLDLRQAAKHGRMIDRELGRRPRERAGVGDGLHVAKIVPGEHAGNMCPSLHLCK